MSRARLHRQLSDAYKELQQLAGVHPVKDWPQFVSDPLQYLKMHGPTFVEGDLDTDKLNEVISKFNDALNQLPNVELSKDGLKLKEYKYPPKNSTE